MFDLKGRVAAVSGASSGLGQQMARAFAKQGADLAIMARRVERLEEFKKELEGEYGVKLSQLSVTLLILKKLTPQQKLSRKNSAKSIFFLTVLVPQRTTTLLI